MEIDGVIGILQCVASKQQHDSVRSRDLPIRNQLLEPSESHSGCRLAADPFTAQLRLGHSNLSLAHVKAPAASLLDHPHSLPPRSRIPNSNRGSARVSLHRLQS